MYTHTHTHYFNRRNGRKWWLLWSGETSLLNLDVKSHNQLFYVPFLTYASGMQNSFFTRFTVVLQRLIDTTKPSTSRIIDNISISTFMRNEKLLTALTFICTVLETASSYAWKSINNVFRSETVQTWVLYPINKVNWLFHQLKQNYARAHILIVLVTLATTLALMNVSRSDSIYRSPLHAWISSTNITLGNQLYIVANNPKTKEWSPTFTSRDLFYFFNDASLLSVPGLKNIPKEQVIIFLRQVYSRRSFHGVDQLKRFQERAKNAVFVVNPTVNFSSIPKEVQFASIPHIFIIPSTVVPDYPEDKIPSTGFVAYYYAKRHQPDYRINLVGFTGQGWNGHNFDYEQHIFHNDTGITLID